MLMVGPRAAVPARADGPPGSTREPLQRVVDLDVGESRRVQLRGGSEVEVKLLALDETRDPIRDAVRRAMGKVEGDGHAIELIWATFHLPRTVAGVQVDCPITKGYTTNSDQDHWGLTKAARLRFWPAGSPWVEPGTFVYPVRQRWFASATQMANEPTYVDEFERPTARRIYYHSGLDIGGAGGRGGVGAAPGGVVGFGGPAALAR